MSGYVIDASVFAKLFLDEPDRPAAHRFVRFHIVAERKLVAPDILTMECLSVALRYGVPFAPVLDLLDSARGQYLELISPTSAEWQFTEQLALGDPAFGRPGLADSLYHATAIRRGATLVTADRSHFNKTKHRGHVTMLADWREG